MNAKVTHAKTVELAMMTSTCIPVHVSPDLLDKIVKQVTTDDSAGEIIVSKRMN